MRQRTKRNSSTSHGDFLHYTRGCRCALCRAANALYNRENRKKLGKDYVRNCNLKCAHGLTLEEYNTKLTEQNGVCASCHKKEVGKNQFGLLPLAVDHDHSTGKIRGLLCMRCNRALGMLGDSETIIENLLTYRRKHAC